MTAKASSFAPTASYSPVAAIDAEQKVGITGRPFQLSGGNSTAFTWPGTGAVFSYSWQQLSGPGDSLITGNTSSNALITAPTSGEYSFQLTVTDSAGHSNTTSQTVGVVSIEHGGTIVRSAADTGSVLGPVIPQGSSPWPWYEATEVADVDALAALMTTPPSETPGPGVCSIPNAWPNQLSDGNVTAKAYGGVAIVCSGSNFTQADVGSRIAFHWDANQDGSLSGRFVTYINQVVDGYTLVANQYWIANPASAVARQSSWAKLGADYGPYNASDSNSFVLMFYEAGLAVERLYERTQLIKYRTQFHSFCDNWWRWALDSGYGTAVPRNSGLHTMIACAEDSSYNAPPGMWDGIARLTRNISATLATTAGSEPGYNPADTVLRGTPDIRESSYVLRNTALLARLYGKHGGDSAAWCGYLANQLNHLWLANAATPANVASGNYAYWEENLFLNNPTYVAASRPAGDPNGHFGTSPWRSAGLPALALIYAYEALTDSAACNNPVLADKLFNRSGDGGLIPGAANYVWDFGRYADGGLLYAEGYETDTGNTPGWTVFNSWPPNGTVSVASGSATVQGAGTYFTAQFGPCDGSTGIIISAKAYKVAGCIDDTHLTLSGAYDGPSAVGLTDYSNPAIIGVKNGNTQVVGSGTKFTVLFAPCNGTTYIGIVGQLNPTVDRRVYQVTGCTDDTHLTLNLPYSGPSEPSLKVFSRAHRARENCGPLSHSTSCEPDRYNGRNLSSDIAASSAWLFARTRKAFWKERAEYYANKAFGGSADGAGGIGAPTGPQLYARPGVITVKSGSNIVVGVGAAFLSQFACNGSDTITIADNSGGYTWSNYPGSNPEFYTLNVASCADDNHLTLASNYPGTTSANVALFYNATDPQWQGADGGAGNLGEILPACGPSHAPPCGIGDLVPKYGKPLGMASGAGDTPSMMANIANRSSAVPAGSAK
jgi:hypothetical protein